MKRELLLSAAVALMSAAVASAQSPTKMPDRPSGAEIKGAPSAPPSSQAPKAAPAPAPQSTNEGLKIDSQKREQTGRAPSAGSGSTAQSTKGDSLRDAAAQSPDRGPATGTTARQPKADSAAGSSAQAPARQPSNSRAGQSAEQTSGPSAASQTSASGSVTLSEDQRTRVRQDVLAATSAPRVDRVDFRLSVGIGVPSRIRLVEVPPTLVEIRPAWRNHRYFVVRDEIVIVDRSRRIVAVIPVGSSRADMRQTTTIVYTPEQIRRIQIVLIERGLLRGRADGIFGPKTRQALVVFQRRQGFAPTGDVTAQTVTSLGLSAHFDLPNDRSGSSASSTSAAPSTNATSSSTPTPEPLTGQTAAPGTAGSTPGTQGTAATPAVPPLNNNSGQASGSSSPLNSNAQAPSSAPAQPGTPPRLNNAPGSTSGNTPGASPSGSSSSGPGGSSGSGSSN